MQPPETSSKLPSFLVIGAIKAATTWISHHLKQTPAVFMPKGEEPHYFTREYDRGLEWYRALFSEAQQTQIIGEKTADYLANPDAPKRASDLLPDAKLIISVRNPVERAYSDYCMLFRRGTVSARIEDYLDPDRAEFRRFLENGLYYKHINTWLDHYPAEKILILTMEDVKLTPDESLRKIAAHIGLSEDHVPKAEQKRVNDSKELFLPLELRKLLSPFKKAVAPARGNAAFQLIRGALARPVEYPKLTAELKERLADFYAADIEDLGKLLKRDLAHWSFDRSRVPA